MRRQHTGESGIRCRVAALLQHDIEHDHRGSGITDPLDELLQHPPRHTPLAGYLRSSRPACAYDKQVVRQLALKSSLADIECPAVQTRSPRGDREAVATQDGKGQHGGQASPSAHGEKIGVSAHGESRHGGKQLFE